MLIFCCAGLYGWKGDELCCATACMVGCWQGSDSIVRRALAFGGMRRDKTYTWLCSVMHAAGNQAVHATARQVR